MGLTRAVFNFADMRFSGQLQQNNPTSDAAGGQTDNFVTLLTTRVYLEKMSGKFGYQEGAMLFSKVFKLTCRFQSAIVINSDTRWLINGETYTITDFERVDMVPHLYTMIVTKNQPD